MKRECNALERECHLLKQETATLHYQTDQIKQVLYSSVLFSQSPKYVFSIAFQTLQPLQSRHSIPLIPGPESSHSNDKYLYDEFQSILIRRLISLSSISQMKRSVVKLLPKADHEYLIIIILSQRDFLEKLKDFFHSKSFLKMMHSFHCVEFQLSDPIINS